MQKSGNPMAADRPRGQGAFVQALLVNPNLPGIARTETPIRRGTRGSSDAVTATAVRTAGRFASVKSRSPGLAAIGGYNGLYVRLPSTAGRGCESRRRRL
jgi:hypothetical protein